MRFRELDIAGAWLVEPDLVGDERGVFRRHFCKEEFAAHGIEAQVSQGNVSENPSLHTLRGFHYQLQPHAEGKTLSCFSGALYDIIVDLRLSSRTYLRWTAVTLDAGDRTSLHVPAGCANAYLTMAPDTVVHYYMSEIYAPGAYRGFRYNDPAFEFSWPAEPRLISQKDRSLPDFDPALLGT